MSTDRSNQELKAFCGLAKEKQIFSDILDGFSPAVAVVVAGFVAVVVVEYVGVAVNVGVGNSGQG